MTNSNLRLLIALIISMVCICTCVCAENVTTDITTLPTPAPGITTARATLPPQQPITTPQVIHLDYNNNKVYFGETVDLTYVTSFSGKFAWWADGEYDEVPDLIVDTSKKGFYERYFISSGEWRLGKWYRWDEVYEPKGNMLAFEILPGVRQSPTPTKEQDWTSLYRPTPTPTPSWSWKNITSDIIIVRGDDLLYTYSVGNKVNEYKDGYLWLFGESEASASPPILGDRLDETLKNQSVYRYSFSKELTEKLVPGVYIGYMQFIGNNSRLDIYYDTDKDEYNSPYKAIDPVPLRGYIPMRMRQELEKMMANKEYSDDIFIKFTIQIKEPIITFTEYYEENDNVIIMGKSPIAAGTKISFIIDPERWVHKAEADAHTYSTTLSGEINQDRTFRIAMPINWDELSIGWNHTIVATIEKNDIVVSQRKDFRVSSITVNPVETPSRLKVIVESYGWHTVNNTNYTYARLSNGTVLNIPVPTPETVYVYVNQTVPPVIVTILVTPSQTPTPESDIPAFAGIVALVCGAVIVLIRRR